MSDDENQTPLEVQRLFGAGISRKRVDFIPAGATSTATTRKAHPPSFTGDQYLSIVLKHGVSAKDHIKGDSDVSKTPGSALSDQLGAICEICNLPLKRSDDASTLPTKAHESSIAHQICLEHSHPPSHLDRDRQGLKYLVSYGWDPDSRLGLGATGKGIRVPIKAKIKNDTVGLGVKLREVPKSLEKKKIERLDAKKVRKKELEDRKKGEKLREIFYGNDDVERYLGGGRELKVIPTKFTNPKRNDQNE